MTKKRLSDEEKLKIKWDENWANEWQWIIDAVFKEYDNKKDSGKVQVLEDFVEKYVYFMDLESNCHYNKDGKYENKCVVNQYVSDFDKVEYRSINFDAIGKKAKLVTVAHGSLAGMIAYLKSLKSLSTKMSLQENSDVRHKFFTDLIFTIQPKTDTDGKECYSCSIETVIEKRKSVASFQLTKKLEKNGKAFGKVSNYKEICDLPKIDAKIK